MESFTDQSLILSLRSYMDKGFVISVFTRRYGRISGFAYKSALAGIEIGTQAETRWEARTEGQLGAFKHFDIERNFAPLIMDQRLKLALLQSICAMCDTVLPEREMQKGLFDATLVFLDQSLTMDDPLILGALYVKWELLVLQSLGYGLDLSKCAATETTDNLIYVSPKTGKAVCGQAGEPYKDKLLTLPAFLRPATSFDVEVDDIKNGLTLTQAFFEKWVLTHMSANLPNVRYTLAEALERAALH